MPTTLPFEMALLERMADAYRASTLAEIGLTESEAMEIRARCSFSVPGDLACDLSRYESLLGNAALTAVVGPGERVRVRAPALYVGSTAHYFNLLLWPHLFWVVYAAEDRRTLGMELQNQVALRFQELDPAVVRVGVWTQAALEELADEHFPHDGWDEVISSRLRFGDQVYEGTFVLGLLQAWKRIDTPPFR